MHIRFWACVVAGTLLLAGCGSGESQEEASPPPEPESSQSLDTQSAPPVVEEVIVEETVPIELSKEEAGARFLDVICGVNTGIPPLNEAMSRTDEEWFAGMEPDMAEVNRAAEVYADLLIEAITVFDDPLYVWPSNVSAEIGQMRDGFMEYLQPYRGLQNAVSYNDSVSFQLPDSPMPSQEIRYQLGLSSDPAESCVGHEGNLSSLAAAARERIDAQ